MAYDRELERQDYDKRIADAESRAFKRILSLDPEKAKMVQAIERLDQDRPDLGYLSFEHKIEWLNRNVVETKRKETQEKTNREQDLAGIATGGRSSIKGERLPDWVHDREVQHKAEGMFASKKELADWSDPRKAAQMAEKNRPKYANG